MGTQVSKLQAPQALSLHRLFSGSVPGCSLGLGAWQGQLQGWKG